MTVTLIILLCLSVALNVVFFLVARAQYIKSNKYEQMVVEFGEDAMQTYVRMKNIDDRQMFEKDDDVGVIFQDMVNIIERFNEKTQAKTEG